MYNDYLIHYGVPGQKWGVRNYENYDGSLTDEGKERYGHSGESRDHSRSDQPKGRKPVDKEKIKKAAIIGGAVAAAVIATYGAYKVSEISNHDGNVLRAKADEQYRIANQMGREFRDAMDRGEHTAFKAFEASDNAWKLGNQYKQEAAPYIKRGAFYRNVQEGKKKVSDATAGIRSNARDAAYRAKDRIQDAAWDTMLKAAWRF